MDRRTRILILIGLAALLFTFGMAVMNEALAEGASPAVTLTARTAYTAKFMCGFQQDTPAPPAEPGVKPGNYATVVDFFNPGPKTVNITKRVVLMTRENYPTTATTPPTKRFAEKLMSNGALGVDCKEIVNLLTQNGTPPGPAVTYITGFLIIESSLGTVAAPLDVVATYTTAADPASRVNSIEVVPITGRALAAGTWPF